MAVWQSYANPASFRYWLVTSTSVVNHSSTNCLVCKKTTFANKAQTFKLITRSVNQLSFGREKVNIESTTQNTPGWYQRLFAWLMAHATAKYEAEMSDRATVEKFFKCQILLIYFVSSS